MSKKYVEDYQRILKIEGVKVKVERMVFPTEFVEQESSFQDNIDVLFIDCYVVQINEYLYSQKAEIQFFTKFDELK